MSSTMPIHCTWFQKLNSRHATNDGVPVGIVNFNHVDDVAAITRWATHFRQQYITDADLVSFSSASGMTKANYLKDVIFPGGNRISNIIVSGDFAELLVADYLEYLLNYQVPRFRYSRKANRNTSTQGIDVIGYKKSEGTNPRDELISFEVKSSLTSSRDALQKAIDDSKSDYALKLPMALSATAFRLADQGNHQQSEDIKRFMNKTASPYEHVTGAAAVFSSQHWNSATIQRVTSSHPNSKVQYIVFTGAALMDLAKKLYEVACASA